MLTRSAAMQTDDAGEFSRRHSAPPAGGRAESLMQGADMVNLFTGLSITGRNSKEFGEMALLVS